LQPIIWRPILIPNPAVLAMQCESSVADRGVILLGRV
jgi:hypothetical protein